jgi:hypothetical protein
MAKNDIIAWIREKITTEVVIAFVLGVVLGLVVLGWWLWPVQWANSNPADLKPGHKESYIQMIADSYALTANVEVARARLQEVKSPGEKDADLAATIDRLIKARIAAGDPNAALRLQGLARAVGLEGAATPSPITTPAVTPVPKTSQWLRIMAIAFFLLLLGTGVVLLILQLQRHDALRRRPRPSERRPDAAAPEMAAEAVAPSVPDTSLGHFETTYNLGDDSYDVSYSIESASGEFLGECGVSALEAAGIGKPGEAAAFELWLFDKDDVRTETKILASERAFADAAAHDILASKGELVKAEKNKIIPVETANLRLDARIVELAYDEGSNAGTFARLTTQLKVSRK